MKRGNSAVPFKELGSSPAKDKGHGGKKGHNHDDALDEQSETELTMENSGLTDLRSNDKNIDLDNATDIPVRRSGFGPRTSFGGVKNPELVKGREPEDLAE